MSDLVPGTRRPGPHGRGTPAASPSLPDQRQEPGGDGAGGGAGARVDSSGHRAAVQLLALREVVLPAAVVAAADALLDHALASDDPVTCEAAAATRSRLRAAIGLNGAAPGHG